MSSGEGLSFFEQLKRRGVIRVAIGYAAAVFIVLQVADLVLPALGVPDGLYRLLVIFSISAFPIALLLAWLFDVSPEGVRRATAEGRSGPVVVIGWGWLAAAAGVVAALAIGGLFWTRPGAASGDVAAGATVIAVLPFETHAEGVEGLGEGMVDLLSRNLDEVGGIRTVEPRVVLYRWKRYGEDGPITPDDALALGREVQAGSILSGSITVAGATVRIIGDLRGVDGTTLASAEVDRSAADLLGAVDSFSVELLRDIWRSRQPLPRFNVAAITTGDPQAIRAYLRGERYYRASAWDSAATAFERAIAADSSFALAHYRLLRTVLWRGGPGRDDVARREAAAALRLADRLPARERTLVLADYLRLNGRSGEGIDTLRAYLERYPDDPEALFTVVDDAYHERESDPLPGGRQKPLAERVRAFDRVLELDPAYTPALIHPLELALATGDSAIFERHLGLLEEAAPAETLAIATYRTAFRATKRPNDRETLLAALRLVNRSDARQDLAWQARMAAVTPLTRALIAAPPDIQRVAVERLTADWGSGSAGPRGLLMALRVLVASGRLREARQLSGRPAARSALGEGGFRTVRLMPAWLGYVGAESFDLERWGTISEGDRVSLELLTAIDDGVAGEIRAAARRAREYAARVGAPDWRDLAAAGQGFVRALEGEPIAGLDAVDRALGRLNDRTSPYYFRWADWMGRQPATRERALELLADPWNEPAFDVPRQYALGRALEAAEQGPAARAAYGRFVAMLAEADSGLRVGARLDSARASLERLEATAR